MGTERKKCGFSNNTVLTYTHDSQGTPSPLCAINLHQLSLHAVVVFKYGHTPNTNNSFINSLLSPEFLWDLFFLNSSDAFLLAEQIKQRLVPVPNSNELI